MLDPSTDSRSGKALIPHGPPSGEQGSIRRDAPGQGWTLQVSGAGNAGKSQKLTSIITRTTERMEGFRGGLGPARPKSLAT